MRNLIALFACSLVLTMASAANDPHLSPSAASASARAALPVHVTAAAAVAAASAKPGAAAAPKSIIPSIKPNLTPPPVADKPAEDDAEADLSAKIAARLAQMRANQQARAAAAAKARQAAEQRKRVAALAVVAPPKPVNSNHWSYEGEAGPANWGKINTAWGKCGSGERQSPIDIRDGMKVEMEEITFDYKPSSFTVTDNGHTVQVDLAGGNYIAVSGRQYELLQFHFHRPGEERINGRTFEMVVHLVHRDPEGKLAVIAVLLERGKAQNMIQTVWNNLPLEKYDVIRPSIVLDPSDILPPKRDYFAYMGSLTTPPCTEGVLWMVMKEQVQATPAQMALFSRLYPMNARPLQANAGRVIKESN
jgi:carbonic anhydrase